MLLDLRAPRLVHGCLAGLAVALACAIAAPVHAATLPAGFSEVTIKGGLADPTGVAWAPDGRLFVVEKGGRLRVVKSDGSVSTILDISDHVNTDSDRGLLGVAVDKDFASNHYVYLLYVYDIAPLTADSDGPMVSRLTRVTVNPDSTVANPANPETVILGSYTSGPCPAPSNDVDCIPADFHWHTIGTVRSDPVDGSLWVGSGDATEGLVDSNLYRPYDERSFAGKIIHVDRNGNALPGHPFCPSDTNPSHVCAKLYAKGFRNPYRFTLRPGKGPVVGDVGSGSREEIDLLKPGGNYGWPCYEGDIHTVNYRSQSRCTQEFAKEGTASADQQPAWSYAHTGDPAQGAVVAGPQFAAPNYPSDYANDVFVGDYVHGWIKRLEVDSGDHVTAVHDFATGLSAPVDLEVAPNGDLAYVDIGFASDPSVRRFAYVPGNGRAVPHASATPTSGDPPLEVQFKGSDSTDPDGDTLSYDWDFGDGSAHSSAADPLHTYTTPKTYTATLTVDDGTGRDTSDSVQVTVNGDEPPQAKILDPANGSAYSDGQTVNLEGQGTDDQPLPPGALSWQALLHHITHIHDWANRTGADASFVTDQAHDADSYYEIRLTVTDSGGQQDTDTVLIHPRTVHFAVASSPTGASLAYGGSHVSAVGFRTTVDAPASFTKAGEKYSFGSWSDGGGRSHTVVVPAHDDTLTARYDGLPPAFTPPGATDDPGPLIDFQRFDARRGLVRGAATSGAGLERLWVAVGKRTADGKGCRWWQVSKRRLSRRARRCAHPLWIKARIRKNGDGWTWRASLRRRKVPAGVYRVVFKAVDAEGKTTRRLGNGKTLTRVRVHRRRR